MSQRIGKLQKFRVGELQQTDICLKENLKNYQKKATDQFKDFAENDWPNIKDHLTEKGQQAGDFLKQNGGKAYQNSVKAFKKAVRNLDQKVNGTSIHKDDK